MSVTRLCFGSARLASNTPSCRMRFAYPAYKIAACRPDKTRQRRIRR
ncbi:ribonucleoside diphosreductase [Escherichia coli]|nr:ribonucleoside diphosreductase [Escherichia coli]